ncbi:hypothetical protein FB446DRAFT_718312 [Lentinula raphanica]|nr:hypothetical protein FB446DRAFT_718312 [Lentinula raphanica]
MYPLSLSLIAVSIASNTAGNLFHLKCGYTNLPLTSAAPTWMMEESRLAVHTVTYRHRLESHSRGSSHPTVDSPASIS